MEKENVRTNKQSLIDLIQSISSFENIVWGPIFLGNGVNLYKMDRPASRLDGETGIF